MATQITRQGIGSGARWLRAGVVGVLVTAGLFQIPAEAAGIGQAVCVGEVRNTLSPGISLSPTKVTYTSRGQTGSIKCVGSVDGHDVTGPGTLSDDGVVDGSCVQGSVSATAVMIIPTDAGPVTLRVPVVATYLGTVGVREGGELPGGFAAYLTKGDCAVTPVTEIVSVFHGVLVT